MGALPLQMNEICSEIYVASKSFWSILAKMKWWKSVAIAFQNPYAACSQENMGSCMLIKFTSVILWIRLHDNCVMCPSNVVFDLWYIQVPRQLISVRVMLEQSRGVVTAPPNLPALEDTRLQLCTGVADTDLWNPGRGQRVHHALMWKREMLMPVLVIGTSEPAVCLGFFCFLRVFPRFKVTYKHQQFQQFSLSFSSTCSQWCWVNSWACDVQGLCWAH